MILAVGGSGKPGHRVVRLRREQGPRDALSGTGETQE
jgi:hypothetical protein